jgi:hypothetical protein
MELVRPKCLVPRIVRQRTTKIQIVHVREWGRRRLEHDVESAAEIVHDRRVLAEIREAFLVEPRLEPRTRQQPEPPANPRPSGTGKS